MYKVTNISGHLMLLGLYPSESKNFNHLDDSVKELYSKQLVSIQKIKNSKPDAKIKVQQEEQVVDNFKDCEVIDTDGRN